MWWYFTMNVKFTQSNTKLVARMWLNANISWYLTGASRLSNMLFYIGIWPSISLNFANHFQNCYHWLLSEKTMESENLVLEPAVNKKVFTLGVSLSSGRTSSGHWSLPGGSGTSSGITAVPDFSPCWIQTFVTTQASLVLNVYCCPVETLLGKPA